MLVNRTAAALVVAVWFLGQLELPAAEEGSPGIKLLWKPAVADTNLTLIAVTGVPGNSLRELTETDWTVAQWQTLFYVVAETGDIAIDLNLPPMAGSYQVTNETIRFLPNYPLTAGVRYRATFRPAALPGERASKAEPVQSFHQVTSLAAQTNTFVKAVYPSTALLPENLLKFYLHFSAPMSRGRTYDHIKLRNSEGEVVELPFLELDQELWNRDMTRLTLFLDPGRIKRGVRPLEEVGAPLEVGKGYTLVIGREWLDSAGHPLREDYRKGFIVAPSDREPPDPAAWKIESPAAKSRNEVRLVFGKPLDRALLERMIQVVDGANRPVAGRVMVGPEERSWNFVPEQPWQKGDYKLLVPKTIEDLAGNNIGKAFDVDLHERVEHEATNRVVTMAFSVR